MSPPITAVAAGLGIGASLIIAIGAQNAFVLRQGLKREQIAAVVAVCVICDWLLISLGALGFGSIVRAFPPLTSIAAWGGAVFLLGYGAMSFRAAIRPKVLEAEEPAVPGTDGLASSARVAVGTTLGVSLLNPHVYLDTVVLLGSVAAQFVMPLRAWFALGACAASLVWFSVLGFGARLLAPTFARPGAWRVLDAAIGGVMWWIAIGLIAGQLR